MPKGWTNTTLGEACDLVAGFAFKGKDFGDFPHKVIKIKDINPPLVDITNAGGVSIDSYEKEKLQKYLVDSGDFVLAMTGATIGKIGRLQYGQAYLNQRVLLFKAKSNLVDKDYLYYSLGKPDFMPFILNHIDSQTAQANISASSVGQYRLFIPPLPAQRAIAATLSALDAKIVNNTKINNHLEQMAQAIFKSWFVDFEPFGGEMPDNWREGTISEIANVTMGQSPDGSSYNESGVGTVFYQGRAEFGSRFPTRRLFTTQPKRMAAKGDVLMSVRAPVGDLNVAIESCCLGRGLAGIQSNNGCQSFILYTMFALKQTLDMFNGEGTVFGSINKNDMANLPVLIPTDDVLRQFEELVNPMDASIEANYAESCNLQAARDSLLPRLMSGELSVADIDTAK
jgi:type I restriction enzyme S subunit